MSKRRIYIYSILFVMASIAWIFSYSGEVKNETPEITKIALREVGHQLLLANKDTTSLVLPVINLGNEKYKLSFQNKLSIEPDSLVSIIKKSLKNAELSEFYIVEVLQCTNDEVAYSYKMRNEKDKSIIPCKGRDLPSSCYTIEVSFIKKAVSLTNKRTYFYMLLLIALVFLLDYIYHRKFIGEKFNLNSDKHVAIGIFQFYPEQNKLVKAALEISLSKKECELLEIFVANANQIVKREDLTKQVWEDNGVIVGRSLDTYISKLRKKLQDDESIKLTNVHGVGYKLEIS